MKGNTWLFCPNSGKEAVKLEWSRQWRVVVVAFIQVMEGQILTVPYTALHRIWLLL